MSNNTNKNFLSSFFKKIKEPQERKHLTDNLVGDLFGGTAAMLVAMPSAIAFGLIIYNPLGAEFSGQAAIGGIIGTIAVAMVAALFGGTKRLVSAPCAPAAAVLSVFVSELVSKGSIPNESIPILIVIVSLLTGIVQLILGNLGGGRFIKYIPYPVVAGYLSGVGILIFFGQLPKFLGFAGKSSLWKGLIAFELWRWESITIGLVTILVMVLAPRFIKKIPAAIVALISGIATYFVLSIFNSSMLILENNKFIIGPISASLSDISNTIWNQWSVASTLNFSMLGIVIIPTLTLAVLLSIDTLKTCVILDALTFTRHNSNKELIGQGLGNITSAIICGVPGAGTSGATLVNLNSGAKTQMSGFIVGFTAVLVLLLIGNLVAWIPLSALAGILLVVGYRMVDKKSFTLLKNKSTRFDFFCILVVIIAAVSLSLIAASGVGIGFAILLFLREQIRSSVIRRKIPGNQIFSKKLRVINEIEILSTKGDRSIIIELQGQLFFGTTDQLLTELEPFFKNCKYITLDMKRVQSVDFTAVNMLKQIQARIKKLNGFLIFASVPLSLPTGQNVKGYLDDLGLSETENLKFFDSLDSALEWVEDEILKEEKVITVEATKALKLSEIEIFNEFSEDALKMLSSYIEEKNFKSNELIFEIGVESDEIYFVRKGLVKIVLPLSGGVVHHLVSIGMGGFFGDMAFLDKGKRSAIAVAVGDVDLFILSRSKFENIEKKHPEIAGNFFEMLAYTISNRLRQSNIELKALQEN